MAGTAIATLIFQPALTEPDPAEVVSRLCPTGAKNRHRRQKPLLIVDCKLDAEARTPGPVRIRRATPVSRQVAWIVEHGPRTDIAINTRYALARLKIAHPA